MDDAKHDAGELTPPLMVKFLAKRFECHPKTMLRWLKDGEVPGASRVGTRWQIPIRILPPPKGEGGQSVDE